MGGGVQKYAFYLVSYNFGEVKYYTDTIYCNGTLDVFSSKMGIFNAIESQVFEPWENYCLCKRVMIFPYFLVQRKWERFLQNQSDMDKNDSMSVFSAFLCRKINKNYTNSSNATN